MGAVRRFQTPSGLEYGTCVKASVTGLTGKNVGGVTYVVTVAKNQVSDRRRATPEDECDGETYQRLQQGPQEFQGSKDQHHKQRYKKR